MTEPPDRVRLNLLGAAVAIGPDNAPLAFRSRKSLALLAYLALGRGTPHSRERLAGLLWPNSPERRARGNLRVELARLNGALGASDLPWFVVDRGGVGVAADAPLFADAHEFERLVGETRAHRHDALARCESCHARLVRAAELYGGDFLDGFHLDGCEDFEDWQRGTRERLRGAALETLAALAEQHEAHGRLAEAERCARRELSLEPLREDAHRELMALLARQGRRGEALARYRALEELLRAELGVAPDEASETLHDRIERGELDPPAPGDAEIERPAVPHNLPAERSAYIGHEAVLGQLDAHLDSHRLITLVGIGGIGKTRLALELARRVLERYPDGAFVARLAALADASEIPTAIAAAVGFRFEPGGDTTGQLLRHLSTRRLLLVLDNFEHLIDGGAALVGAVLDAAPGANIVVTSRRKLGVDGESPYVVPGLSLAPASRARGEAAGGDGGTADPASALSAAARLFLDAAHHVRLDFVPRAEDLDEIERVARLVGGHPLALVLAAGALESLSCREIADELSEGIELLASDALELPERQRSVAATFRHSWSRLDESERAGLAALSVFRGGFDREAARTVADVPFATLRRLLGQALVAHHPERERYELHELMRQFAAERLAELGASETVAARHSDHYLARLRETVASLDGETRESALAAIGRDFDNVRAAWRHALGRGAVAPLAPSVKALRTVCALAGREHDLVNLLEPALPLVERAVDGIDTRAFELDLLLALGVAYRSTRGYLEPALAPLFERAFAIVVDLEDSPELFAVLYGLWSFNLVGGRLERALEIALEARRRVEAARERGDADDYLEDARFIAHCLEGPAHHLRGDNDRAIAVLEAGLAIERPPRRDAIVAVYGLNFSVSARYWLAIAQCLAGRPDSAVATAEAARTIAAASAQPLALTFAATARAIVAVLRRDAATARASAREMRALVSEHRIGAITRRQGQILEGYAIAADDRRQGIERMRRGIDDVTATPLEPIYRDFHACLIAEVLLADGRADEAAVQLAATLEFAEQGEIERFHAETLRLEGEVWRAREAPAEAEARFRRALEIARAQGAMLFELRAATSLARLAADAAARGLDSTRHGARRAPLADVLGRLVEGFDTADVVAARATLDGARGIGDSRGAGIEAPDDDGREIGGEDGAAAAARPGSPSAR